MKISHVPLVDQFSGVNYSFHKGRGVVINPFRHRTSIYEGRHSAKGNRAPSAISQCHSPSPPYSTWSLLPLAFLAFVRSLTIGFLIWSLVEISGSFRIYNYRFLAPRPLSATGLNIYIGNIAFCFRFYSLNSHNSLNTPQKI